MDPVNSSPEELEQEDQASSPGRASQVRIYRKWCKGCGICTAFCPKGALEKGPDGSPVWKYPERCTGCRMCELRCPDLAIEVVIDEDKSQAAEE